MIMLPYKDSGRTKLLLKIERYPLLELPLTCRLLDANKEAHDGEHQG